MNAVYDTVMPHNLRGEIDPLPLQDIPVEPWIKRTISLHLLDMCPAYQLTFRRHLIRPLVCDTVPSGTGFCFLPAVAKHWGAFQSGQRTSPKTAFFSPKRGTTTETVVCTSAHHLFATYIAKRRLTRAIRTFNRSANQWLVPRFSVT